MSKKEIDIQNEILHYLNSNGIFAFRINTAGIYDSEKQTYRTPGKFTMKGCSDIIGICNGRFLAIEVKSEKGILKEHQQAFIDKVNKCGGIGLIARSLKEVIDGLAKSDS